MTTSTELVGPLKVGKVRFGGGPSDYTEDGAWIHSNATAVYTPPANTLDPRYEACTDHHVACDCREAEFAEYRTDARIDFDRIHAAFANVLSGHQARVRGERDSLGRPIKPCQCTGCQIARLIHVYPKES